ncbi:MAG: glycerophosphodiester phosphodiesterase family protein [Halanaerobiaceae bacterium]
MTAFLVILIAFIIFYGGYYLLRPSEKGREILQNLNIPYPSVIAHRGASVNAPESSRPAFVLARKEGADYLEADIQRTKDGKIVIFHDRNLKRLSNVEEVFPDRNDYTLGNFTYDELLQLDFGNWFNKRFPGRAKEKYIGLKILTLAELIDIIEEGDNTPGIYLEFKNPHLYPGIEEDTINILKEKGWLNKENTMKNISSSVEKSINDNLPNTIRIGDGPSRIVFISFDLDTLDRIKNLAPEFPRLLLINDNMIGRRSWDRWLELAEDRVHGLGPKGFVAWPWHIADAHKKGLFVSPYVINKLWQVKILSHFRADAFITDNPNLILDFLGRLMELTSDE